jgi:hypothetical protein
MDSDDEEEQMFAEIFEEEMAAAAQDEEHKYVDPSLPVGLVRGDGHWSPWWVGTRSLEVQAEAANGGLLHTLRRLRRRQSIAR